MLRFSMQLKILIFAIPFLIMIIWHFIPQKKKKEEDSESQSSEEEKDDSEIRK